MARHPHRLPANEYYGLHAYFLTACTLERRPAFADADFGRQVVAQLLRSAEKHRFDVIAYCLMPDHAHLLAVATTLDADFVKWINLWRQLSGFASSRRRGEALWQEGYWDYTLRDDEAVIEVAAYIVNNPVRAGLVASVLDYPLVGSARYTIRELVDSVQLRPRRHGGRGR